MNTTEFKEWLKSLPATAIHPVVSFNPKTRRMLKMDFTEANTGLTGEVIEDTGRFSEFVSGLLARQEAKFGIGGYAGHRTVYSRSRFFHCQTQIITCATARIPTWCCNSYNMQYDYSKFLMDPERIQ
ncbi:MAG: hypothetical protein I8H66_05850 [Sphingobacteriia bacterium]|nr:hypothetical protein [Sphingobacteriia bacterium]